MSVKVYALPPSQNAIGAVLLTLDAKAGEMVVCDLMKGEHKTDSFLAINPYGQIPAIEDSETGVKLGESCAILRYLAMQYKPAYYPVTEPKKTAQIDFAIDAFASNVYPAHKTIVYAVMGFGPKPEDQAAANTAYIEAMNKFAKIFLPAESTFINQNDLSIADFKIAPYFFAAICSESKIKDFVVPDRIKKYIDDFCAAVPATSMLKDAGGFSIAEFIEKQTYEA